jgi:hypothetical protein
MVIELLPDVACGYFKRIITRFMGKVHSAGVPRAHLSIVHIHPCFLVGNAVIHDARQPDALVGRVNAHRKLTGPLMRSAQSAKDGGDIPPEIIIRKTPGPVCDVIL